MSRIQLLYSCFFSAVIFLGCEDNKKIGPEEQLQASDISEIIIDHSNCAPTADPDLKIENARVEENNLKITITYGGGCGTISNKLLTCGYFMESNPVQLNIALSHEDNDPCEALLKKEINFDLSPLVDLYDDSYREHEGVIILRLDGFEDWLRFEF